MVEETIGSLKKPIRRIEQKIKSEYRLKEEFEVLLTMPGLGTILALTIMLEVGDIGRLEKVGNYTSYYRRVCSTRESNGKKKGVGNRRNGNQYLT